jgi:hypothetical protein
MQSRALGEPGESKRRLYGTAAKRANFHTYC